MSMNWQECSSPQDAPWCCLSFGGGHLPPSRILVTTALSVSSALMVLSLQNTVLMQSYYGLAVCFLR